MERRGFLASLLGLVVIRKMPTYEHPPMPPTTAIVPGLTPYTYPETTITTTQGSGVTYNLGSPWVHIEDVDAPWSYTANTGTTGVTLTFG